MTPCAVLSLVLELSAKGYSRAVFCRIEADKQLFQRQFGITAMRESYTIMSSQIGKLCAFVSQRTMTNRLI